MDVWQIVPVIDKALHDQVTKWLEEEKEDKSCLQCMSHSVGEDLANRFRAWLEKTDPVLYRRALKFNERHSDEAGDCFFTAIREYWEIMDLDLADFDEETLAWLDGVTDEDEKDYE